MFETLEDRRMMSSVAMGSNATLLVYGDAGANQLLVRREGNYLGVYEGQSRIAQAVNAQVKAIVVYGYGGDDALRVVAGTTQSSVYQNASIFGGAGNDTIYSGAGNDYLEGNDGADRIVTIGGSTDYMRGGTGADSIWADSTDSLMDATSDEWNLRTIHRVSAFLHYNYVGSDNAWHMIYPSKDLSGQNLPDPFGPAGWTQLGNVSSAPLFGKGPSPDDVYQGSVNDCYILASFSALARHNPSAIRQSVAALGDGTYAARFYDQNRKEYFIRVDGDLPVDASGNLVAAWRGAGGNTWVPLMEKAYAIFRNWSKGAAYSNLDWGYADETFRALGCKSVAGTVTPQQFGNNATVLLNWIRTELSNGAAVVMGTSTVSDGSYIWPSHVYEVVGIVQLSDGYYLKLRNPWGVDGKNNMQPDGAQDGYLALRVDWAMHYMSGVASAIA